MLTLSPDCFSNALTIAATPAFGTGSEALEPRLVLFDPPPPPPPPPPELPPVHEDRKPAVDTPAAPTANPLSTDRREMPPGSSGVVGAGVEPGMDASWLGGL